MENDIQHPMQLVLDPPMTANPPRIRLHATLRTPDEIPTLFFDRSIALFAFAVNHDQPFHITPFLQVANPADVLQHRGRSSMSPSRSLERANSKSMRSKCALI